jgi:hypothetical protein
MEESTSLSKSFADQGLKIRIRKELRQRRKLSKISDTEDKDNNNNDGALPSPSASTPATLTSQSKSGKRPRTDEHGIASPSVIPPPQHLPHHRIDLLPNPTRYISYNSKQDVSDPHRPDNTRYYTHEDPRSSMNHSSSSTAKSDTLAATVATATMSMPIGKTIIYNIYDGIDVLTFYY